jgi:hypothetical protein
MLESIKDYKTKIAIPAISAGSISALRRTLKLGHIDKNYRSKKWAATLLSVLGEPFRMYERSRYNKMIDGLPLPENPVFIIGHWRSGTTYLHNMICEDPSTAYVTTYQGTFPEVVLGKMGKFLFKNFMRVALPSKRQGDNVEMNADYPQEEEFAIANTHSYSFYNFWYFPSKTKEFYKKYINFEGVNDDVIDEFKKSYERIVKTAMLNTGGTRFVSKNPPNTGRIKMLLEIFPKAKFIFIYRNPYNVFLSNKKFLKEMMPSLQLEQVGERKLEEVILWTYQNILNQYYEDKHLIPEGNLAEIRFEEFEQNPLVELEKIYGKLGLSDFDRAKRHFSKYANKQRKYKKNKHNISERELKAIQKEWKFTLDKWKYDIPDNLRITPDIEVVSS